MATSSGYTQLEPSLSQIRLLHLLPLQTNNHHQSSAPWHQCVNLECTFETVHLASAPPYEALSYTWGDEPASVRILLNGKELLVRPNLAYALAALRTSEPRVLWVDALCINQKDTMERNHQVGMMGGIFRRADRVLVWLGRPSSNWDSSVAGALQMAKRIGENPPTCKLPPPPPQPSPHNDSQFIDWINLFPEEIEPRTDKEENEKRLFESRILHWRTCQNHECPCWHEDRKERVKTEREKSTSKWQDRLDKQRRRWRDVKEEHAQYKRRVERLPAMIQDRQTDLPFLAPMEEDLKKLGSEEVKQQELLNKLRRKEIQHLDLLQAPQQRLVQDFQDAQLRAYQELDNANLQKSPEAGVDPEGGKKTRPIARVSGQVDQDEGEIDRLFREILADLGDFQRSIYNFRKKVREDLTSPLLRERISRLNKMQQLDMDQRRGLAKLRDRLQEWEQPIDRRYATGQQLLQSQVGRFEQQVKTWESLQNEQIEDFGDLPKFIAKQYESLQSFADLEETKLRQGRDSTDALVLSNSMDEFLTEDELHISESVKRIKKDILKQQFVLRSTELRRWKIELVLQQCGRWRSSVYEMKRKHRVKHELPEESINAQREWIRLWKDMSAWQAKEWHDIVFAETDTSFGLPNLDLLSLEAICRLPYWRRLWIVQEVLLAKELVLCFGDNAKTTTSWDLFTKARESLERVPSFWQFKPVVSASLKEIKNAFPLRLDKLRQDTGQCWSLHNLVDITMDSLCHDPRDKIYGLLGITSGFKFGDFDIRYQDAVEHVYRNAISWYHSKHGEDANSPNLVRFSQLLQLSLKSHQDKSSSNATTSSSNATTPSSNATTPSSNADTQSPNAVPPPIPLDMNLLSGYTDDFCIKRMLGSPILPIDKLIGDKALMQTRHRDWISTLVEYFDDSGFRGPKTAIEEELLYLDSISTTLSLPTSSAYAVVDDCMSDKPGPPIHSSLDIPGQGQEPLFFVTLEGEFGISSTCVREGDLLCRFPGSTLGVILRRRNGRYELASKAIMSSITKTNTSNVDGETSLERPVDFSNDSIQSHSVTKGESSQTVQLMLDIASILSLTTPLEIVSKHETRQPLYIQETSFDWDEFIASGCDVAPSPPSQKQVAQTPNDPLEIEQEPAPTITTTFTVRTRVFSSELTHNMSKLLSGAPMVSLDINETYTELSYPDPTTLWSKAPVNLRSDKPVNVPTTVTNPQEETHTSKPRTFKLSVSLKRLGSKPKIGALEAPTDRSTPDWQGGKILQAISGWWNR
uniref:Heterokaryon incompatibility domain-containing protein n=1 Tax=Gibberella zeae TaxID=5518 RepID=A0A4E9DDL1_GIBZA